MKITKELATEAGDLVRKHGGPEPAYQAADRPELKSAIDHLFVRTQSRRLVTRAQYLREKNNEAN